MLQLDKCKTTEQEETRNCMDVEEKKLAEITRKRMEADKDILLKRAEAEREILVEIIRKSAEEDIDI